MRLLLLIIALAFHTPLIASLSSETAHLPTISQSRFVPLSSALHDLSDTLMWQQSPELLWELYLNGHSQLATQALFHLPSSLIPYFSSPTISYTALQHELYQPNSDALRWLVHAAFLKEITQAPPEKEHRPLELAALAPGLWVGIVDHQVVLLDLPKSEPWSLWKKGTAIGPYYGRNQAKKEYFNSKLVLDSFFSLIHALKIFESFQAPSQLNLAYEAALKELKKQSVESDTLDDALQTHFPLSKRLEASGTFFKLLPPSNGKGEWISLHALLLDRYDPWQDRLVPIGNFTAYPDSLFQHIQQHYRAWIDSPHATSPSPWIADLFNGYSPLQQQSYLDTALGSISYPSFWHLELESFYSSQPLWHVVLALLILSLLAAVCRLQQASLLLFVLAFAGQTLLLGIRCFLLQRPPVTNMAESLLFVPWSASCLGIATWLWTRQRAALYACSTLAIPLIGFAIYSGGSQRLEQVQPVLNSQYWLTVHVIMVVSSYGAFLLAGILAHGGLWKLYRNGRSPFLLERLTLICLYIGTALLIAGTLLGGIWAAQSWGRFWDWDPKEAWAFITSVLYLLWIHAYRFRLISTLGLDMGAISGLWAVSFTWYGVNYILGTGLHSYGFGSGGELIYLLFIALDITIVSLIAFKVITRREKDRFISEETA